MIQILGYGRKSKGDQWGWRFKLNCQIAMGAWKLAHKIMNNNFQASMAIRIDLPNCQWRFGGLVPFDLWDTRYYFGGASGSNGDRNEKLTLQGG